MKSNTECFFFVGNSAFVQLQKDTSHGGTAGKKPEQETLEYQRVEQLEKITRMQRSKIRQLEYERWQIQKSGRLCPLDCVLCVIHWTCKTILRYDPICNRLLEKVIMRAAGEITDEDVNCGKFMTILHQKGIVPAGSEIYNVDISDHDNTKRKKAKKAWKILMTRPKEEQVCILGDLWNEMRGHTWAVDLRTKTEDKVTIYDPQSGHSKDVSEELFIKLVSENNIVRLMVYTVDLKKLKQIIQTNEVVLEQSRDHHSTSFNRDAPVATNHL